MMQEMWLTFLLRLGEYTILAMPGLLAGGLVAGLMGSLITVPRGQMSVVSLIKWWIGLLLLPFSSLGALIVAQRLYQLHASRGLIILALLGGLSSPASIAWLMGMTSVTNTLLVVALSGVVIVMTAWTAQPRSNDQPEDEPYNPPGIFGFLDRAGHSIGHAPWVIIGLSLVLAAMAAMLVPAGFIEHETGERSLLAMLLVAIVALPGVITPDNASLMTWQAIEVGAIPGAAILWFLLGGTCTLGTLIWLAFRLRWTTALKAVAVFGVSIALSAVVIDRVVFTAPSDDPDTHAFDALAQPWRVDLLVDDPSLTLQLHSRLLFPDAASWFSPVIICVIAMGMLIGFSAFGLGRRFDSRAFDQSHAESANRRVAIAATMLGLAWIVAGVYVFFPSFDEGSNRVRVQLAELTIAQVDGSQERIDPLERVRRTMWRTSIGARLRFDDRATPAMNLARELDPLIANPPIANSSLLEIYQQWLRIDASAR